MRAVVQRVKNSSVTVEERVTGQIGQGLMVLIGVEDGDTEKDAEYIAKKVSALRVFDDEDGVMNRSVQDIGGEVLAVSQFTLLGDVRKGNRPSYFTAAKPEEADALYQKVIEQIRARGIHVEEGVFQADMLVSIENDGPVTILLESHKLF
jgi:D-tyrosyl-tRNA(Tyr) deacylase